MLRSIVARSQPLLSHLCRSAAAAAPGGAKPRINPSRAYAAWATPGARCNGSAAETTSAAADRHLYVVLQEKAMNRFSIYKLPHVDDEDDEAPRSLPRAVLHLGESLVTETPQFEALGTKMVVTADIISGQFLTFLYVTKTETVDGAQSDPKHMWVQNRYHAAAPVGDKLYLLEAEGIPPFYFYRYKAHAEDGWAWGHGREPLPVDANRMQRLSGPGSIKSLAVHPDGRNIFASSTFTFSLDMESEESVRVGDWRLPFHGRAYYDGNLDAWVGIRLADGTEGGNTKGHPYLCACDVPTALAADNTMLPEPAWKMCKKELTFVETPAHGTSPTLVHTGHGKFCLVEVSEGVEASRPTSDGLGHMLRVTMFHATHGRDGELEVTPYHPGRSYLVPNYSKGFYTAIWM